MHCHWNKWGGFTSCSTTCGEGEKSRYRTVYQEAMNGGDACLGSYTDTRTCNAGDCPPGVISSLQLYDNFLRTKSFDSNLSALPVGNMGNIYFMFNDLWRRREI